MKKFFVTSIKIRLPFWLRWAKRLIRLEVKKHYAPNGLRGRHFDTVILDESGDYK